MRQKDFFKADGPTEVVMRDPFYPARNPERFKQKRREAQDRYRRRHPERVRKAAKQHRLRRLGLAKELSKKQRSMPGMRMILLVRLRLNVARRKGIKYDKAALYQFADNPPSNCECCGTQLDYTCGGGRLQNGPSIDQVNPKAGYIFGNIAILCNRCNTRKGGLSAAEHRAFADFIDRCGVSV